MTNTSISKGMNAALWTAQAILAIGFIWAASMKWFQSSDQLAEMWPWTASNITLVKITGFFDLLAGLGLVLPGLLKLGSKWTIYAAYGTVALMVVASTFHISRGEASSIGINVFFALAAVFIAWGRRKEASITGKRV